MMHRIITLAFLMVVCATPAHAKSLRQPVKFMSLETEQRAYALGIQPTKAMVVPRAEGPKRMALPGQKRFFPINRGALIARYSHDYSNVEAKQDISELTADALLAWPVDPDRSQWISSPFGWRDDPFTREKAFHAGVDIAVPVGTKVRSVANGTVTGVGEHPRLGKYVKVTHAGDEETYSLYGHLGSWSVKKGDRVRVGETIAKVGMTGRTTGAHLDFSLRKEGKPVDPMDYLTVPQKLSRK